MPELLEVEQYRRAALALVGRRIRRVGTVDPWYLRGGPAPSSLAAALEGSLVAEVRRIGKLLLVDLDPGPVLGLRFGMTGRLVVDDRAPIGSLAYGPGRWDPGWRRFALELAPAGSLVVDDARRLGRVVLDPDESALGPDAAGLTVPALREALGDRRGTLKGVLMDQRRVAGLGNLLVDETLWRAGLDPARPAGSLTPEEAATLHRALRATLRCLEARGGSHTGDLQPERHPEGRCPRDGVALVRRHVAGRTTYSCPVHQR